MNRTYFVVKRGSAALLIIAIALLAGCSVAVKPGKIASAKGFETVSLKGVSLIVANGEKDSTPFDVPNEKGQKPGILANKREWTAKLVDALSGELAKRGAQLKAKAPLQISIAMPDIVFSQTRSAYQFTVKVAVTSSKGWSKTYDAVAETGAGLFESPESLMERLSGQALAEAIKLMLGDAEFLRQLSKK